MKCSPGGTLATLNRPSGPAIASPRIDIAAARLRAEAEVRSERFSLRVADDSADPRHPLRHERERGARRLRRGRP